MRDSRAPGRGRDSRHAAEMHAQSNAGKFGSWRGAVAQENCVRYKSGKNEKKTPSGGEGEQETRCNFNEARVVDQPHGML